MTESQANNNGQFSILSLSTLPKDLTSGLVVFLVALPLCLGIAVASDAPPFSGVLAGIVGGLIIGSLSGSHTSVSGPAAGLTAIVIAQQAKLGSFEAFLLAVVIGGVLQIILGVIKAGALSAFFPSSVIKGLLAAIGTILILKQIPYLVGHQAASEGQSSSEQSHGHNPFGEIIDMLQFQGEFNYGALTIGAVSLALLIFWKRTAWLAKLPVPGELVAVLLGLGIHVWLKMQVEAGRLSDAWGLGNSQLVSKIPVVESADGMGKLFTMPDFSVWNDPAVYLAGVTIAIVASLETLLNLEAVDKLDPHRRHSPPSRELLAQGIGNVTSGLIGGLPTTSVIVRSSVNVNTGCQTKRSAIFHGMLLLGCVAAIPQYLNMIPLASLAGILIVTGFKLASPKLFRDMWSQGRYQFLPFIITLVAIVLTDLLIGILIGLGVSLLFILNSNLRRPIRRIVETHLTGDVLHIELANQVSFLNRAALDRLFNEVPRGSHVLLDATGTDYIDPDVLSLMREFKNEVAPAHGVTVSHRGFQKEYQMHDEVQFVDYSTWELQDSVTPHQVLDILLEGNRRFRTGQQLTRDYERQIDATSKGQHPLAVVLGCIDSRVPAEIIFDLGLGDIFSTRVAGNVIGTKSLGSIEYGVAVARVKLVLVLGHTHCGAVTAAIDLASNGQDTRQATGCEHLNAVVDEIRYSMHEEELRRFRSLSDEEREALIDEVASRNVLRTVKEVRDRSPAVRQAVDEGRVHIVGALYDVRSGEVSVLTDHANDHDPSHTRRGPHRPHSIA